MTPQSNMLLVKESRNGETRVALIPDDVAKLIGLGCSVQVESNAGLLAGYSNSDYVLAGATIAHLEDMLFSSYQKLFHEIDLVIRVKRPARYREILEAKAIQADTKMVGSLDVFAREAVHIAEYHNAKIDYISFEQFVFPPDTPMEELKTMSHIAGRLAVQNVIRIMEPVNLIKVAVILGFGEAGRSSYLECKKHHIEQIIVITGDKKKAKEIKTDGYSSVLLNCLLSLSLKQAAIAKILLGADLVIASASSSGAIAPLLIPNSTLLLLKANTCIVDLAASEGGNVEGSVHDGVITLANNVRIINVSGYPKELPSEASKAWSKACYYFLSLLLTGACQRRS